MACKDQRRLAIQPQLREQRVGARLNFDAGVFWMSGIMLPDMVKMGEFGADTAEIVPHTSENGFDFFGRFFREGGREIGSADLLFAQRWPDQTSDPAEQVGGFDRIERTGAAQQSNGQRAHGGFAD